MDANTVLLWTVALSVAMLLLRQLRAGTPTRGWLIVALVVGAATAAAALLVPSRAGYVGGIAWAVLLLAPSLGSRWLVRLVGRQQYGQARWWATGLAVLHPLDGWPRLPRVYQAWQAAQRGDRAGAAQLLRPLEATGPAHLRQEATVQRFRATEDWQGLVDWVEAGERGVNPAVDFARVPSALVHYVRALGETGQLVAQLQIMERWGPLLESEQLMAHRGMASLYTFAFGGRVPAATRVLTQQLTFWGPALRALWVGTAQAAAGQRDAARALLTPLLDQPDGAISFVARRRLEQPPVEASAALTATSVAILDQLEQRLTQEERYGERMGPTAQGPARITRVLALVIGGMFALQLLLGGSEDIEALYRLGALYSGDFSAGDSWRLLAAGFLHLGPIHLAMNLLGLLVLGPYLERALGGRRFLVLYLLAGVLSSAMVLVLALALEQPTLLVGASGSIMGIIGGTGAVLLRGWRRERAAPAGRRLRVVAIMLAAQVVFDVVVPHVSMSAHLAGLLIGFVVASRMRHW